MKDLQASTKPDPTPTPEQPHEHHWRFDGDDPRLVCKCGEYRDALTGEPIEAQAAAPEQDEAVRRAWDRAVRAADTETRYWLENIMREESAATPPPVPAAPHTPQMTIDGPHCQRCMDEMEAGAVPAAPPDTVRQEGEVHRLPKPTWPRPAPVPPPERFDRSWWHYADDCPVPPVGAVPAAPGLDAAEALALTMEADGWEFDGDPVLGARSILQGLAGHGFHIEPLSEQKPPDMRGNALAASPGPVSVGGLADYTAPEASSEGGE